MTPSMRPRPDQRQSANALSEPCLSSSTSVEGISSDPLRLVGGELRAKIPCASRPQFLGIYR